MRHLRRFNWLFVYTPILIGALVLIGLFGLMLWNSFRSPESAELSFYSGLADIILILVLIPLILVGLLGPAALGGLIYWAVDSRRKRKEQTEPQPEGMFIQRYSWQLENIIDRAAVTIDQFVAKIAAQVIRLNGWLDYVAQFLRKLANRSIQD